MSGRTETEAKDGGRRIIEVLEVVDTREYEEVADGRYAPIPGSGNAHDCSRCGRSHEVHATVRLDDGSTCVVGTGCAAAETADVRGRLRRGASAAKRLRTLEAEHAALSRLAAEYARVHAEVAALPMPAIVPDSMDGRPCWYMGDVWVVGWTGVGLDAERRRVLEGNWREARAAERGITYRHRTARFAVEEVERAIAKVRAALCE